MGKEGSNDYFMQQNIFDVNGKQMKAQVPLVNFRDID
jgi:hypothetical protein